MWGLGEVGEGVWVGRDVRGRVGGREVGKVKNGGGGVCGW